MKFQDFKKKISLCTTKFFLLEGTDCFLKKKALEIIYSHFNIENKDSVEKYDGTKLDANFDEFYQSLQMGSLFGEKIIYIEDYYPLAADKNFKNLKKIISEIDCILIINNQKTSNFSKIDIFNVIDCSSMSEDLIALYIKNTLLRQNIEISSSAIALIIQFTLGNMTRIENEVNKLISYSKDINKITDDDVCSLVSKTDDYKIYEVTDAIGKGNNDKAIEIINSLKLNSSDLAGLFAMIYGYFRRLLYISISSSSDQELAKELDCNPYVITIGRKQVSNFSPKQLMNICNNCSKLDLEFKSGNMTGESAFWSSLIKILLKV